MQQKKLGFPIVELLYYGLAVQKNADELPEKPVPEKLFQVFSDDILPR